MGKKTKPFKTYQELRDHLESLQTDTPPYPRVFSVDELGMFQIHESHTLAPEEALRLGKWLIKFYEDMR